MQCRAVEVSKILKIRELWRQEEDEAPQEEECCVLGLGLWSLLRRQSRPKERRSASTRKQEVDARHQRGTLSSAESRGVSPCLAGSLGRGSALARSQPLRAQSIMDIMSNQPVVLDNGSGIVKAGFAGADKPKVMVANAVGRPKHKRAMAGGALDGQDIFVGAKVQEHRGAFRISHPMSHGIVENWPDMERVWSHVYDRDNLNTAPEEHPLLLTEAPLNPYRNRQKCAEVRKRSVLWI
jgi:hypothetical protein